MIVINNGFFNYSNEDLNVYIIGEYYLDENNEIFKIISNFSDNTIDMKDSLLLYNDNGEFNYNINCNDLTLLNKVLSVFDEIIEEIENSVEQDSSSEEKQEEAE